MLGSCRGSAPQSNRLKRAQVVEARCFGQGKVIAQLFCVVHVVPKRIEHEHEGGASDLRNLFLRNRTGRQICAKRRIPFKKL